jgi:hypothetical protein
VQDGSRIVGIFLMWREPRMLPSVMIWNAAAMSGFSRDSARTTLQM